MATQNRDELDKKFDEFALSLAKYFNQRFDDLEKKFDDRFEKVDQKIDRLQSSVDEVHGMLEVERDERTVIAHQLDRHEDWIERASRKLSIDYDQAA
ncbi:hypothetical protein [Streptomyces sp. B93]|uniref:hypothetical protein n=1 Tax=Streptomyces sp. B93 TaxID=2824875 RepID=UPI001B39ABD4|nr:hypothetical protein [Streptomyces sp. B93]MBQ1089660.1 hypothetical protein [Streptomyces sp. B93]